MTDPDTNVLPCRSEYGFNSIKMLLNESIKCAHYVHYALVTEEMPEHANSWNIVSAKLITLHNEITAFHKRLTGESDQA